jgi:hypothetical protein
MKNVEILVLDLVDSMQIAVFTITFQFVYVRLATQEIHSEVVQ